MSFEQMNHSDFKNSLNVSLPMGTSCTNTANSEGIVAAKALAYTILLCVSLIGNVLVVFVIYKNKNMRTTVNYFIVNMALSDLILPLLVIPLHILNITSGTNEWRVHGTFGLFLCKFVYFVSDITPPVSSLSLVFMTVDRFCAVAFPMKAVLIRARYRVILIALTWMVTMAFFAPYFYAFNLQHLGNSTYCLPTWPYSSHKIFATMACIVFIMVPFALLIGLYTAILVILRRNRGAGEELEMQRKRRAKINISVIKLALTIVLAFAICWGPINTALFIVINLWDFRIPVRFVCSWPTVIVVVQFLAYSNPAINPLIYFILNENYRKGLKRAVKKTVYGRNAVLETSGHSIQHSNQYHHSTKREVGSNLLKPNRDSSM